MAKQNNNEDLFEQGQLEENVLPPDNIVVLNEVRSASDLNRLMTDNESINIRPDFQREEVWTPENRSRFIDSMSKEFPIPSMCFALDPKKQDYIVIDGLQRMSTIKYFFKNEDWVLSSLRDIDERISGKSVGEIRRSHPELYRRIENISLPITILRYDPTRRDNMDYIYTIFQRINTFGERLNPQEIRNAIFQGPFNYFIKECGKNKKWLEVIKKQRTGRKNRMVSEENVLRFFAFNDDYKDYSGKLNLFLNNYLQKNRFSKDNSKREKIFYEMLEIASKMKVKNFGKSNALKDATLFGISKNIYHLKDKDKFYLNNLLQQLEDNENFSSESLSGSIMQKSKTLNRLHTAKYIFSK